MLIPKLVPWKTAVLKDNYFSPLRRTLKRFIAIFKKSCFDKRTKAFSCVHFNVTNVIYAFAYTALYYTLEII
ncbi:Uncharacterized protein DBV15_11109 [Temnothorax longispinosus]|uniref:Uncharacterized protein n=1 Tax=Temnothorax longispinosus TaxID=300112 RepID=A0A4S2KTF4_9HYME|nr:Uncharacterized protein DBV15_11109 [Temnothorax longispinosus]